MLCLLIIQYNRLIYCKPIPIKKLGKSGEFILCYDHSIETNHLQIKFTTETKYILYWF